MDTSEHYKKIFSDNLRYYMEFNDKTQVDIIRDLGINKSAVSTWCNGTRLPRMDKIDLLAKYFNIRRADLIEIREAKTSPTPTPDLTGPEASLIGDFRTLNDTGKAEAQKRVHELTMIEDYTQEGEAKKDGPASA